MRICLYEVLAAEGRRSMDLCAEQLGSALGNLGMSAHRHLPPDERFLSRLAPHPLAGKLDVLVQRHFGYALPAGRDFDIHHVIDHSYAHLMHRLPPERTVITCHDLYIYERLKTSRNPLFQAMCRHILSGLDRARWVICVSRFTAAALAASGLASQARVRVAYNGIDPAFRLLPREKLAAVAARFSLTKGAKIIHVGDCHDRKNIETLLAVVAGVRLHCPVTLIKVGGTFSPTQQGLIARLGLSDHICHLHGVCLEDLVALYNLADVCVFPSWLEGFGFPVLESMASGTPVVASDRSSLPELVGTAGLLADPADAGRFVAMVLRVLEDPELRADLTRRGLAQAALFTWRNHAREVLDVYEEVLAEAGSPLPSRR